MAVPGAAAFLVPHSFWLQKLLRGCFLMLLQPRAVGLQQGGAVQEEIRSCHPPAAPRAPSQRVPGEPSAPGTAAGIGT